MPLSQGRENLRGRLPAAAAAASADGGVEAYQRRPRSWMQAPTETPHDVLKAPRAHPTQSTTEPLAMEEALLPNTHACVHVHCDTCVYVCMLYLYTYTRVCILIYSKCICTYSCPPRDLCDDLEASHIIIQPSKTAHEIKTIPFGKSIWAEVATTPGFMAESLNDINTQMLDKTLNLEPAIPGTAAQNRTVPPAA